MHQLQAISSYHPSSMANHHPTPNKTVGDSAAGLTPDSGLASALDGGSIPDQEA